MPNLVALALHKSRATLLALFLLIIGGLAAYVAVPKEAFPDVSLPLIYVSVSLEGISPEDSERLLVRPLEQEMRTLAGVKKISGIASEGQASVLLEFDAGFDAKRALLDVRQEVDNARSKLPDDAKEPRVHEINTALFPILSIGLAGPVDEATLMATARNLQQELEALPEILEVDIGGEREDLLEVLVHPLVLETYALDAEEILRQLSLNNRLVAAGSLDTGQGRQTLKVPGVIETFADLTNLPIKATADSLVTFGQVTSLERTFKDPSGFARIDGQPAVVLEVTKRSGANIMQAVGKVKALLEQAQPHLPADLNVSFLMDQSQEVQETLDDLLNNVATAVVLVMLVVIAAMGVRSSILVGITIPGAFLTGILAIWALGFTLNTPVLFALILVAGMLVDGALVVAELANRYQQEQVPQRLAWQQAAARMFWPIVASTATTICVFLPLLFWPGMVGKFMRYLPITVILCLLASLAMALIFLPTLGSLGAAKKEAASNLNLNLNADADTDFKPQAKYSAFTLGYKRFLAYLLRFPVSTLVGTLALVALIYLTYAKFNFGIEFFPKVEPESAQLQIRARGDISIYESDALVQEVEARLLGMPEVKAFYARSFLGQAGRAMSGGLAEDVIGVIQFQFIPWHERRRASLIMQEMHQRTADIAGVIIETREQQHGPGGGSKPFELQLSSQNYAQAAQALQQIKQAMQDLGGFTALQDDLSLPGVEWRFKIDREQAARFGTDVTSVGSSLQLVTQGLLLAKYRPEDAQDEVDIRLRLAPAFRNFEQLNSLSLHTPKGQVPLSNFVSLEPGLKTSSLNRINGRPTLTLKADLAAGFQLDERIAALQPYLQQLPAEVSASFAGESADMLESMQFLVIAFVVAIFLMLLILVLQFNSLYQAFLVLSAIVFSTAGVLLGLLVTQQSFGLVMVGMGIIALAGIVVNNNIVLIDTYNRMRQQGLDAFNAALETSCLRLRPVLLTAITTVLGLIPMVLGLNVNLLEPSLGWNAPATQWWSQLSSAIAGGLSFATLLTLILTPSMLVLGANLSSKFKPEQKTQV